MLQMSFNISDTVKNLTSVTTLVFTVVEEAEEEVVQEKEFMATH